MTRPSPLVAGGIFTTLIYMDIQCYAQRLLNPFRGIVNGIKYGAAEAVTTDGLHRDIYVSHDELTQDLENPALVQTSDIR